MVDFQKYFTRAAPLATFIFGDAKEPSRTTTSLTQESTPNIQQPTPYHLHAIHEEDENDYEFEQIMNNYDRQMEGLKRHQKRQQRKWRQKCKPVISTVTVTAKGDVPTAQQQPKTSEVGQKQVEPLQDN